jgi:paired amphipathic helix protein Sin3a
MSETGFVSHKKTQYEEALHKCEEERYEFDLNIEANLSTIALLEPIYNRILKMSTEEKTRFKLPVGLGG